VIEAFRAPSVTFLSPLAPETLGPETIIDISHESLIRQWVTLRKWARDEYQAAEMYRSIERSAKRWKDGLGNLLTKLDLANALKWYKNEHPTAAWAGRYGSAFGLATEFLRKSQQHRFRRRALTSAAISVALVLIAGPAWLTFYVFTLMQSDLPYMNPAGEFSDYNVPSQAVLKQENIRSDTPLTMGPTLGEFSEAKAWIANDEAFMNVGKRLACGRVGQLVEILSSIDEEAAEEEVVGRT
jgi:hypothetical protein